MDKTIGEVAAPGVLLWLLHGLLRASGWVCVDSSLPVSPGGDLDARGFAGDVNLLPQVTYRVGASAQVAVRALRVGDVLFVHLVAADKSLRLPLRYMVTAASVWLPRC